MAPSSAEDDSKFASPPENVGEDTAATQPARQQTEPPTADARTPQPVAPSSGADDSEFASPPPSVGEDEAATQPDSRQQTEPATARTRTTRSKKRARRPTGRQWTRLSAMVIVTVAAAVVGLTEAPKNKKLPQALTGHAVFLADDPHEEGDVQIFAADKLGFGNSADVPPPSGSNWITIEMDGAASPALGPDAGTNPPAVHHWALLLEDVPRLTFSTRDKALGVQQTVTALQPSPGVSSIDTNGPIPRGDHFYLIAQDTPAKFASFSFAAPGLTLQEDGGYASIKFPSVTSGGIILGADALHTIGDPTAAFSNTPSSVPGDTIQPQQVTDYLDFPTQDDPDDYSVVAGDLPLSRNRGEWQWHGSPGAQALLRDANSQSADEHDLFISGVFLGAAGAGVIALILELIDVASTSIAPDVKAE
jgi:hypothetical protein